MKSLKLLLDTNVVIPAEPTSPLFVEATTTSVATLIGLLVQGKHQHFVHPASVVELGRDVDQQRRRLRRELLKKYPVLPSPPQISEEFESVLGQVDGGSHDHVDHSLLSALAANAVDYLVTEDLCLLGKAARLGLGPRAATVADALLIVRGLFPTTPIPPPEVRAVRAHDLDVGDSIFNSFRADYREFDRWLAKVQADHRQAWRIDRLEGGIAAFVIVKDEPPEESGLRGRVLKICSMKIASDCRGFRFGELLLKAVFDYAFANRADFAYVMVLPKYQALVGLLEDFGFVRRAEPAESGELMLIKQLSFSDEEAAALDPLSFHKRFGPRHVKLRGTNALIVPIRPRFHQMLFPEADQQLSAISRRAPYATAIRKAYLTRSGTHKIGPGSVLLFYRSRDVQVVTCLGVAEDTLRSDDPAELARFVGKRTVYDYSAIEGMSDRPVLAILFRQARVFREPLALAALVTHGVLRRAPQSITEVPAEGMGWLSAQIDASR